MSVMFENVPRERLTSAIDHGPRHYRPIMRAVRDADVSLCIVPQGIGGFSPPRNRPAILIVGDDLREAMGPTAFHAKSLSRFIKRCRLAAIVACEPLPTAYAAVAASAGGFRQDAILIETRPRFEADWKDFVEAARPGISFLIATVEPQGGVQ